MPPKYEFTDEVDEYLGFPTLRRIRAVRDFGNVKAGTLGGWIGSAYNLSHEGLAWVADEAKVYEDACILGDAKVCGNAIVCGCARVRENAFNGAFAFVSEAVVDYDSPSQPDARIEIVAREL